ncbi:hypothetical protein LZ554_000070 [Drepanopeziza brunnea f. sp. 'monogermtubi']|nr:hypothetical protein LZ554_000070 [Drepanopeziza brunnea f. sp. 'monogermtubi']
MSSRESEPESDDAKSVTLSHPSPYPSPSSATPPPPPPIHSYISLRTIVLLALPLLSLLGGYGTWALASSNGTFENIFALIASKDPKFPGTEDPLVDTYTTIPWLDRQLTILVTFFAPVVYRETGALTLLSRYGTGQFGGAWTLIVMEGMRVGNRWRAVSFVATMGLIFQNISYTVTVPVWLFLHLLTSPVARPFPSNSIHANSGLLIDPWDLLVLPYSVAISFLLPTILMALHYPSVVSTRTHQQLIAFWQPFPLWTVIAHFFLRGTARWLSGIFHSTRTKQDTSRPTEAPGASYLSNAKHVYRFVLFICISTHVPTFLLALLPAGAVPASMPSLAALASHSFASVYVPYFPVPSYRVSSLAEGVHTFLAWDLHIGSTALLCWAILLHRNATTERANEDPNVSLPIYRDLLLGERIEDGLAWRKLIAKVAIWTLLGGPIAAVAVLLWERDAIVRRKIKQGV